jgi:hypothetical protein
MRIEDGVLERVREHRVRPSIGRRLGQQVAPAKIAVEAPVSKWFRVAVCWDKSGYHCEPRRRVNSESLGGLRYGDGQCYLLRRL